MTAGRLISITLLLATTTSAAAQSTPESAVRAFASAVEQRRWSEAAGMIDLHLVEAWRRGQVAMARQPARPWTLTPEQLMRMDTTLTRAEAGRRIASMRRQVEESRRNPWILRELADVPSLDSLERLPVRAVAVAWLRARDPAWVNRGAIETARRDGCPLDSATMAALRADMRPGSLEVIGSVVRGDSAYVIVRAVHSPMSPPPDRMPPPHTAVTDVVMTGLVSSHADPLRPASSDFAARAHAGCSSTGSAGSRASSRW